MADVALQDEWSLAEEQALQLSQAAINRYLKDHNDDPKPFVWTKSAETIIPKINRLPVASQ